MPKVIKMFRRRNLMNCLPLTVAALLFILMTAFSANAAIHESSWESTGTIRGPPRPASPSPDLQNSTIQRNSTNTLEVVMRSNGTTNSRHSRGSNKEPLHGTKSNINGLHMRMTSQLKQLNPVERIQNHAVTKHPKKVNNTRQVSGDERNTSLASSLHEINRIDSYDRIRNQEFNFIRRERGQNRILPRTLYTGISSFRSRQYIKYPSPFPEDNTFQSYSGCGNSGQCQDLPHRPTNYSHSSAHPLGKSADSSRIGRKEGTSRDIDSHFSLFDQGGYAIPASNDYSFAASQMESGSQSSLTSDFPGLLGAPPIQYSSLSGPSFVPGVKEDFTAVAGATAILSCRIRNLHNYTVSWVRGRDIRLLTTGLITYTSDKRFVPSNPGRGPGWLLKIHYSRKQDAGAYLCQVSLSPPVTKTVNLEVHEAVVTVHPGKEVHVQVGSTLHLECRVRGCLQPVPSWTHGGYPLPPEEISESTEEEQRLNGSLIELDNSSIANPESTKKIVDDDTAVIVGDAGSEWGARERIKRTPRSDKKQGSGTSTSLRWKRSDLTGLKSGDLKKQLPHKSPTLNDSMSDSAALQLPSLLGSTYSSFYGASTTQRPPVISVAAVTRRGVTPQHSGIYTCTSTCTPPINVTVHVLRGEELAAIHHQNAASAPTPSAMAFVAAIVVICFTFTFFDDYMVKNCSSDEICIGRKHNSYVKVGSLEKKRLRFFFENRSYGRSGRSRTVIRKHLRGGENPSIIGCSLLVNYCIPIKRLQDATDCNDGGNNFEKHRNRNPTTIKLHQVDDSKSFILIMMIYRQKKRKSTHQTYGNQLKYIKLSLNMRKSSVKSQDAILRSRPLASDLLISRIKLEEIQRTQANRNGVEEDELFDQFRSKYRPLMIFLASHCLCHFSTPVASTCTWCIRCSVKLYINEIIGSQIQNLFHILSHYIKSAVHLPYLF